MHLLSILCKILNQTVTKPNVATIRTDLHHPSTSLSIHLHAKPLIHAKKSMGKGTPRKGWGVS